MAFINSKLGSITDWEFVDGTGSKSESYDEGYYRHK
jgi:hypothetical protein